jgi:hypothetical protein
VYLCLPLPILLTFGHFFIGQQHKVFDELVRILAFFYVHAGGFAGFIQLKFNLGSFKADGACFKLTFAQFVGQGVQFLSLPRNRRFWFQSRPALPRK